MDFLDTELERNLYRPLQNQMLNQGKRFRARLVQAGHSLINRSSDSGDPQKDIKLFSDIIEKIHLGSLIIDDIEDQSLERRGQKTLHRELGLPLALNLGNYLYFDATSEFDHSPINVDWKCYWYQLYLHTLRQAHRGQALDLGVQISKVPKHEVASVCYSSLDLKTGALTALAMVSGGLISLLARHPGDCQRELEVLKLIGCRFGRLLQIYDDIGNFCLPEPHPKCREDIKHGRPSWMWLSAAKALDDLQFQQFTLASGLGSGQDGFYSLRQNPLFQTLVEKAKLFAEQEYLELKHKLLSYSDLLSPKGLERFDDLVSELRRAYDS